MTNVYIDNGKIRTKVIEKKDRKLWLLALNSGSIEDGKGVNIPNKHLSVPTFPEKDLEIIRFAKKMTPNTCPFVHKKRTRT